MTNKPDDVILVLYDLDEHGEATTMRFYCSEDCRTVDHRASAAAGDRVMPGQTTDAIDGTVCDRCGKVLIAEEELEEDWKRIARAHEDGHEEER